MKSNLTNLEGEYIKFYVTTNSQLPQLLKNSGSMVIYQNQENNINSIYLGGELISCGYGFPNYSYIMNLSYISNTYNDIFTYFNEAYSYSQNFTYIQSSYLNNLIQQRLNSESDISNTYISYIKQNGESVKVNTYDMLIYDKDAEYTKADIQVMKYSVDGNETSIYDNNILELPIGKRIETVNTFYYINSNDTNGVNSINWKYYFNNGDKTISKNISEFNIGLKKSQIELQKISGSYITSEINFKADNLKYYVDEGINIIMFDGKVNVQGTTSSELKPYPDLYKLGINIPSIQNSIQDYSVSVPNVTVKGVHSVFWHFYNDIPGNTSEERYSYIMNNIHNKSINPDNFFEENYNMSSNINNREILHTDNNNTIYIDKPDIPYNFKYLILCVPSKYSIKNVTFIDSNLSEYNWTGFVKFTKSIENDSEYTNMIKVGDNRYIKYNFYEIINSGNLQTNGYLHIEFKEINSYIVNPVNIDNPKSINLSNKLTYSSQLMMNDEKFNQLYWISGNQKLERKDRMNNIENMLKQYGYPRVLDETDTGTFSYGEAYILGYSGILETIAAGFNDLNLRTTRIENDSIELQKIIHTANDAYNYAWNTYSIKEGTYAAITYSLAVASNLTSQEYKEYTQNNITEMAYSINKMQDDLEKYTENTNKVLDEYGEATAAGLTDLNTRINEINKE